MILFSVGKGLIRFGGLKRKPDAQLPSVRYGLVGKGLIRFGGLKRNLIPVRSMLKLLSWKGANSLRRLETFVRTPFLQSFDPRLERG